MSAQGVFEIDPYIRDRLIRFLKEYYGLRLSADQLKHFAMQGCFLR